MKKNLFILLFLSICIIVNSQSSMSSLDEVIKALQEKNKNNPQGSASFNALQGKVNEMLKGKIGSLYQCSAVWTKSNEAEIQVYGFSFTEYKKIYDELWPAGWRLFTLDIHVVNNMPLYTAVWRMLKNNEIQVYGWNFNDYKKKYDELWKDGWRLHILKNYYVQGKAFWTAVWRKDGNLPEVQVYGWDFNDYKKKYDELWKDGWRLHILSTASSGNKLLYSAVWRKGGNMDEVQVYEWDFTNYKNKYDQLWKDGWRLFVLNNNIVNGQMKYTAVWKKYTGLVPDEIQVYNKEFKDFINKYDELWPQGWRLKVIDVAETSSSSSSGIKVLQGMKN